MDTGDTSDTKSGPALTVDNISWTIQGHDVDSDSITTQERVDPSQEDNQDTLFVNTKVHSASHASTISLKSFDMREDSYHRRPSAGQARAPTKSAGCCCIL